MRIRCDGAKLLWRYPNACPARSLQVDFQKCSGLVTSPQFLATDQPNHDQKTHGRHNAND
eukprot:2246796-Amphidinium_carterae.1